MSGIFCSCSSQAPGNCSFSQFPIGLSLTLQVPQVLSSSRSGHLCSWHFAADGVVVVVRGTTVPKGVVVFTLESLVVVDVVVLVTSVSLSAKNVVVASNIVVRLDVVVVEFDGRSVVFERKTSVVKIVVMLSEMSVVIVESVDEVVVVDVIVVVVVVLS